MTVLHNEEHLEKHSFDFFCYLTFHLNHFNEGKANFKHVEKDKKY